MTSDRIGERDSTPARGNHSSPMRRVVIMVFSYDTVCFPTAPAYRVVTDGGSATLAHGPHRAALVAHLTRVLAEHGVAVEDFEQADGEGCFAMIAIARLVQEVTLPRLRELLQRHGRDWGVSIRVQREDLYLAMHRI